MKSKTLFKSILIAVLLTELGFGSFMFFSPNKLNRQITDRPDNLLVDTPPDSSFGWKFPVAKFPSTGPGQLAYSDIRDPGGIPQGLPVRLKIPIIGVDSAIEDALITPDGRMDVPLGSVNVAWFALGPHPGQEGSAVIGGHFGINNGVPFVFYELDKLRVGDRIYIVNDKDETIEFIVRSISLFDRNADATTVFTSDDGLAHLNLITCEGVWNRVNNTYPERRVVFADMVSAQTAPVIKAPTFPSTAIITSTSTPTTAPIPVPSEEIVFSDSVEITPSLRQTLTGYIKSLYSTPIDALITFLLLFSIIFATYKIARRDSW